jgi:hypothetical protein
VFSAKDWVQLDKLLKASVGDPNMSLEVLMTSFTRFAASTKQWDRQHGLAYWATNIYSYILHEGPSVSVQRTNTIGDDMSDSALKWWLNDDGTEKQG